MKSRTITYSFLSVVVAFVFTACVKDKPAYIYQGYDYFPNNAGHWVIYNVDSIYVNPLNVNHADTFNYQVKEVIDSFYTDNTGARVQVIVRYKRANSTLPWTYEKTYTGILTTTEALRTEDGVKYVKLTFPVTANAIWNGGAFNSSAGTNAVFPDWNQSNFQYISVNTPTYLNWQNFDSTITILQDSSIAALLSHQTFIEKYATNIGRIYKQIINLSAASGAGTIGVDLNALKDSIYVPADYIYLIMGNRLAQGSVFYTETYSSSGN
ncbi:MAG TPA: hypothetical protein VN922_02700 [Bacteroidia bacterium]|nr:hypothetical protein [Bacteroidia bacterium]